MSIASPFTWEAIRLYFALDGTSRIQDSGTYYRQPAIYRDVVETIQDELERIQLAKEVKNDNPSR